MFVPSLIDFYDLIFRFLFKQLFFSSCAFSFQSNIHPESRLNRECHLVPFLLIHVNLPNLSQLLEHKLAKFLNSMQGYPALSFNGLFFSLHQLYGYCFIKMLRNSSAVFSQISKVLFLFGKTNQPLKILSLLLLFVFEIEPFILLAFKDALSCQIYVLSDKTFALLLTLSKSN